MDNNTKAVASCNPCIQVFTTTTKKVVTGSIVGPRHIAFAPDGNQLVGPVCEVKRGGKGDDIYLNILNQCYPPSDLKHLIAKLTEIHEVL